MDAVTTLHEPRMRKLASRLLRPFRGLPAEPAVIATTPEQLVPPQCRVVLVAPHPDDEVLALGATIAALSQRGREVCIYAVTDGEGSHPHSERWSADSLRTIRPLETLHALQRLSVDATVLRLGLPDGGIAQHQKALTASLALRPGDTVFVPWRHDGHADHEACARAALAAARKAGARCIEFPVWALVPGHPASLRLRGRPLRRIAVPADLLYAKARAMEAFESQVHPDAGCPAVLQPDALAAWRQPFEWAMA